MAAVALTKVEARYTGTVGATRVFEDRPECASYTAGAIGDADTTALTAWSGPLPQRVDVKPIVSGEAASAEFALSGLTLTITYRTDGVVTTGANVTITL